MSRVPNENVFPKTLNCLRVSKSLGIKNFQKNENGECSADIGSDGIERSTIGK